MSYKKLIRLEILFLLTYHTQAKDIAVVKSGTKNDFWSSCLHDTLNKWSPWQTFSNIAKIRSPWLTFSNVAKIRHYFLLTIIVNRNQNKTTKVTFCQKYKILWHETFLPVLSWWPHSFQYFLNVCHRGKRVCHCGSWFATMTHTQKSFHISLSF